MIFNENYTSALLLVSNETEGQFTLVNFSASAFVCDLFWWRDGMSGMAVMLFQFPLAASKMTHSRMHQFEMALDETRSEQVSAKLTLVSKPKTFRTGIFSRGNVSAVVTFDVCRSNVS